MGKADRDERSTAKSCLLIFLCIFLPPVAVYIEKRRFYPEVLINILLWLLIGIPGIINAFIICFVCRHW